MNPDPDVPLPRCGDKVSYPKRLGKEVLNKRQRAGFRNLRLYQCPKCNYWHLTHKNRERD